jgi:hypothetical protein
MDWDGSAEKWTHPSTPRLPRRRWPPVHPKPLVGAKAVRSRLLLVGETADCLALRFSNVNVLVVIPCRSEGDVSLILSALQGQRHSTIASSTHHVETRFKVDGGDVSMPVLQFRLRIARCRFRVPFDNPRRNICVKILHPESRTPTDLDRGQIALPNQVLHGGSPDPSRASDPDPASLSPTDLVPSESTCKAFAYPPKPRPSHRPTWIANSNSMRPPEPP